jgi:hypothetical protein
MARTSISITAVKRRALAPAIGALLALPAAAGATTTLSPGANGVITVTGDAGKQTNVTACLPRNGRRRIIKTGRDGKESKPAKAMAGGKG